MTLELRTGPECVGDDTPTYAAKRCDAAARPKRCDAADCTLQKRKRGANYANERETTQTTRQKHATTLQSCKSCNAAALPRWLLRRYAVALLRATLLRSLLLRFYACEALLRCYVSWYWWLNIENATRAGWLAGRLTGSGGLAWLGWTGWMR